MILSATFELFLYSFCFNVFTFLSLLFYYWSIFTANPTLLTEYDYIVVGSGTAGSLIAHRIATETKHSHVVLEAGQAGGWLASIPVLTPLLQGSVFDWQYETEPQENACRAMKNNKCKWPRGKVVGGSAVLNNMIHLRGNLSHYSDWFDGKLTVDFIRKQFDYIEQNILSIDYIKYKSKLSDAILNAALEIGYEVKDLNKEFGTGFMETLVNQFHGGRWTTSSNLQSYSHSVKTGVIVEKVIINADNVATGVEYHRDGKSGTIKAKKGIILSAGTINTPQILLRSGIGPKDHLEEAGISLVKELPVGKNLQDHITTGLDLILFDDSLDLHPLDVMNPVNLFNYFVSGQGPLTFPGCETVGIVSTNGTKTADLQFMVLPVGITSDRGAHLKNAVGISDRVWDEYFSNSFGKYTASILPIVMHPKSKGEVKLNIKDLKGTPLINPKYLTAKEDIETLVKGLEIIKQIVNTEAIQKLGAKFNPLPFPGCEKYELFTKDYWQCYVKQMTLTSFHPVGTCKMGPKHSKESVVNREFEVIGLKNLYISDGSVLPHLPSVNINAAIALMANIFFENHFLHKRKLFEGKENLVYCEN